MVTLIKVLLYIDIDIFVSKSIAWNASSAVLPFAFEFAFRRYFVTLIKELFLLKR